MTLEVRTATRSTPEAPCFLWFCWDGGRCIAQGAVTSPDKAESAAQMAISKLRQQAIGARGEAMVLKTSRR